MRALARSLPARHLVLLALVALTLGALVMEDTQLLHLHGGDRQAGGCGQPGAFRSRFG